MKLINKIYKWVFERGCVDYTQPYVEQNLDSGFSKYNTPVVRNSSTYRTVSSPNFGGISGYINYKGEWVRENTMGYYNIMSMSGVSGTHMAKTWQ